MSRIREPSTVVVWSIVLNLDPGDGVVRPVRVFTAAPTITAAARVLGVEVGTLKQHGKTLRRTGDADVARARPGVIFARSGKDLVEIERARA